MRLVDTLKLRFKVPVFVGRFRKTSLSNIEMVRRSQDLAVGSPGFQLLHIVTKCLDESFDMPSDCSKR